MRVDVRGLVAPAVVVFGVVATASASGGFFPAAWGWSAIAFALAAAAALVLADRIAFGRHDALLVGGLAALTAWAALSSLWSDSVPRTVLEVQRDLVYVTAAAAFLLSVRGRQAGSLVAGALTGATAVALWGLSTRVFGDARAGQLAEPLGYWNAVAIVAAMGALLAGGIAAGRDGRARFAAAAIVPPLIATLSSTYSRGGWLALAVGAVALVALAEDRLRALVTLTALAPPAAAAAFLAPRPVLFGASLAAAAVPRGADAMLPSLPRPSVPRAATAACAAGAIAAAAFVFASYGERAYDAFRSPAAPPTTDLSAHVFSASGNARADYWRAAWHLAEDHPLLGGGAGAYELRWYLERPTQFGARDAHNLYLEALAELGPAGLAFVMLALGVPLAALRGPRSTVQAAAGAAYCAYLAHAAVDWDWEVPTVTLVALACGCSLVVARRPQDAAAPLLRRRRAAALATTAAVAALAAAGYAGVALLDRSEGEFRAGNLAAAKDDAIDAARTMPWASGPWLARGDTELAEDDRASAARSFRRAVARDPQDWYAWYELALATEGAERRHAVTRGLELNPRGPELAALRAR
jgi:O-antigen ligase